MRLSANLDVPPDIPLPPTSLTDGVEEHEGLIKTAKVARSLKGGASRKRIRPTVADAGDASATEIADACWAIAYADALVLGHKQRYVCELTIIDGDAVRDRPERIYFDVDVPVDVEVDGAPANGPSHEYVRRLEDRVLSLSDSLVRGAARREAREEKRDARFFEMVEKVAAMKLEDQRARVELVETEGRNRRKDRFTDAVFSVLPKLADKALGMGATPTPAAQASGTPHERMVKLLTADQLAAFDAAVGEDKAEALRNAATVDEAKEILSGLDLETQNNVLNAVGRDAILEMAQWT